MLSKNSCLSISVTPWADLISEIPLVCRPLGLHFELFFVENEHFMIYNWSIILGKRNRNSLEG